jgi:hypothetical protein
MLAQELRWGQQLVLWYVCVPVPGRLPAQPRLQAGVTATRLVGSDRGWMIQGNTATSVLAGAAAAGGAGATGDHRVWMKGQGGEGQLVCVHG